MKRTPLIALTLCAVLSIVAQNCSAADPVAKPGLTVTTAQPVRSKIEATITANGTITAWQEASIGAEVGGLRMAEVLVNVGDTVKRDQVLASFSTDTVLADQAVQKAQVLEASAALADAKANAERARSLKNSGALSAQQINQYLTAEQTANARLEAARAHLKVQELRLRNAQVRAPDDGIISMRQATVGAVVPAGTELFKMVRQGRLEWRAEVTSEELGRIKIGMPVQVSPASLIKGMPPVNGKVRIIGPTVDAQTRTTLVYVDLPKLPDDSPPMRAGMFARGKFDLGETLGLSLPQESVVMRDGFSYVFKLGPDNRVIQLKVVIGRRFDGRVEITDGVAAEDVIVESGAGFLSNGDLVAIDKQDGVGKKSSTQNNKPDGK